MFDTNSGEEITSGIGINIQEINNPTDSLYCRFIPPIFTLSSERTQKTIPEARVSSLVHHYVSRLPRLSTRCGIQYTLYVVGPQIISEEASLVLKVWD